MWPSLTVGITQPNQHSIVRLKEGKLTQEKKIMKTSSGPCHGAAISPGNNCQNEVPAIAVVQL